MSNLEPITDKAALAHLAQRKTVPTGLTSRQIADTWTEDTRFRSFFSARVAKADLLDGMRKRIEQVVQGQMTSGQAKEWIREFLVTDGASSMRELGFLATDAELNAANRISELGSARRISLIVDQNVRMAESVGEWQRFDEVKDMFPVWKYHTREDEKVRASHRALNGTLWRVGSPEAAQVFPPNDFNCRCFAEQLMEDEIDGQQVSSTPPPPDELAKTYRFDPSLGTAGNELPPKPQWAPDIAAKYTDELHHVIRRKAPPSPGVLTAARLAVRDKVVKWINAFLLLTRKTL